MRNHSFAGTGSAPVKFLVSNCPETAVCRASRVHPSSASGVCCVAARSEAAPEGVRAPCASSCLPRIIAAGCPSPTRRRCCRLRRWTRRIGWCSPGWNRRCPATRCRSPVSTTWTKARRGYRPGHCRRFVRQTELAWRSRRIGLDRRCRCCPCRYRCFGCSRQKSMLLLLTLETSSSLYVSLSRATWHEGAIQLCGRGRILTALRPREMVGVRRRRISVRSRRRSSACVCGDGRSRRASGIVRRTSGS